MEAVSVCVCECVCTCTFCEKRAHIFLPFVTPITEEKEVLSVTVSTYLGERLKEGRKRE